MVFIELLDDFWADAQEKLPISRFIRKSAGIREDISQYAIVAAVSDEWMLGARTNLIGVEIGFGLVSDT